MTASARQWLVADIGGTHARFALSAGGAAPRDVQVFECAAFAGLGDALAAYLARTGARPAMACLALAGPVEGDLFRFTNNAWQLSRAKLERDFGFERLLVINDFEALALALPDLGPRDTQALGAAGEAKPGRPLAVLGPGSGLGVATLVPVGVGWLALPGEGGHAGFAPQDDLQFAIAGIMRRSTPRISNEALLSGPGLCAIYAALVELAGACTPALSAAEIVAAALAGGDACALQTIDVFCAVLGAVAGDVALVVGAQGGVFIGGGIAPRLLPLLPGSRFRASFEAKGLQRDYVAAIPTRLVVAAAPALLGAIAALRRVHVAS